MSRAMKRNGQRVYDAFGELTGWGRGTGWHAVTTARVAERARCCTPTARKYLTIMAAEGIIERENFGGADIWRVVSREN
jgi:hypothetical protein